MKVIRFVTTNKGKFNSVSNVLSKFNIQVIQEPLEVPELRAETFEEIAVHKALYAWSKLRKPLIVIDAGLCIPSLNGFPGPYSKYVVNKIGVEGIIKLVENKDKHCYFEHILAYMDSKLKEPKLFSSKIDGIISERPRGKMKDYFWSEYFLIFIPKGWNKTLAELEKEEYEKYREKVYEKSYLTEFGEWLSKREI